MIRLLFTGGGGAGSEALWSLLGKSYELHFGDADISAIHPIIPPERCHLLPWASKSNFSDEILNICRNNKIDLLIPGVDEELIVLAEHRTAFLPTQILLPDKTYVHKMLDKLSMVRFISADTSVKTPVSRSLEEGFSGFKLPCILKPRKGRGSRGVRLIENLQQAEHFLEQLDDKKSCQMLQEKIEGTEYTVQVIADSEARLAAIVPVRVILKRGITIHAVTDSNEKVISTCSAIHKAFPAQGCYNIQLMLTTDGEAIPFEINPRVSTTFCLAVAAGIDPVNVFLEKSPRKKLLSFKCGLQLRRYWFNHFEQR